MSPEIEKETPTLYGHGLGGSCSWAELSNFYKSYYKPDVRDYGFGPLQFPLSIILTQTDFSWYVMT